ncbi:MAG: hypothetical protein IJJ14_08475 [Coriobacteriales bacterium]|nr:hypothetical protein [Coriobacteriales bacterium]MBQ6585637.1 hypothetical protein [Coriobacteriales bacterium]
MENENGTVFYVDYENVSSGGLTGIEALTESDEVYVLYRPSTSKIELSQVSRIMACKARIEFVPAIPGGPNSLDFQLITLLLLHLPTDGRVACIISNDKGYDNVINMARKQGVDNIRRLDCIAAATPARKPRRRVAVVDFTPESVPEVAEQEEGECEAACEAVPESVEPEEGDSLGYRSPLPPAPPVADTSAPAPEPEAKPQRKQPDDPEPARAKVERILADKFGAPLSKQQVDWVVSTLDGRKNKAQLYNYFRSTLGKEQGLEFYGKVKECWNRLVRNYR